MNPVTNIIVVFALTYLGIAMGRVPGLKLNRAGIALLGALAAFSIALCGALLAQRIASAVARGRDGRAPAAPSATGEARANR